VDQGRIVARGTPEQLKAELRGDAIQVELADVQANGDVHEALGPLVEVREVVVDGRALRARADDGARAVPVVLQALESRGVGVTSVRVSRPSLDDVYLRHTGRSFTEADRAGEAPQPDDRTKEAQR
jgi:ABC-2 type transport system ATP-binding protein